MERLSMKQERTNDKKIKKSSRENLHGMEKGGWTGRRESVILNLFMQKKVNLVHKEERGERI